MQGGHIEILSLEDMPRLADTAHLRPKEQWWLDLRPIERLMSQPGMEQIQSTPFGDL
jgi:6-phosphofructokinase 1